MEVSMEGMMEMVEMRMEVSMEEMMERIYGSEEGGDGHAADRIARHCEIPTYVIICTIL